MFQSAYNRLRQATPGLLWFLAAVACLGVVSGVFETTFNNYLSDTFNITASQRGMLELPREMPGFLTALLAGMLFFMAETHVGALCALTTMVGMLVLGLGGTAWHGMMIGMLGWSIGTHVSMPINRSIAMQLARKNATGRRLGQVGAVGVAATIGGCFIVWIGMKYLHLDYSAVFICGAVAALLAIPAFLAVPKHAAQLTRPKLVVRRRYWLYYALCFLFGARKQVFITFGPWVLVRIFHQPAYIFAQLWIVSALVGIFFQPLLGNLIDRIGERTILMIDALVLVVITFAYGHLHPGSELARFAILTCYVIDQISFAVGMARDTYMSKIAEQPDHIAPTLSLGISINHAVSMSLPWLGGWVWDTYGYRMVFVGAGFVAVLTLIFASMVKAPLQRPQGEVEVVEPPEPPEW